MIGSGTAGAGGLSHGLVGPVLVVMGFELAQGMAQVVLVLPLARRTAQTAVLAWDVPTTSTVERCC